MTPQSKVTITRADAKPEKPVLRLKDLEPGTWFVFESIPGSIPDAIPCVRRKWVGGYLVISQQEAVHETVFPNGPTDNRPVRVIDVQITWSEQE